MRTRREIKYQGKAMFLSDYWKSVGVCFVYMLIMGLVSQSYPAALFAAPLTVGLLSHFVKRYRGELPAFETMFVDGFAVNYLRKVGGFAWRLLWLVLWGLLSVLLLGVPFIIKNLSYAMTPYLLSFCPNVKAKDALRLSMKIMEGHKAELFLFHVSFIGWYLLSALTLGFLAVFYVRPYATASICGYYDELFTNALATGKITRADLGDCPEYWEPVTP